MVLWGLQKASAGISFDAMVAGIRGTSPTALLGSKIGGAALMAGARIPGLARVRLLSDHTARRSADLARTADIFCTGISGSPPSPVGMPALYDTRGTVTTVSTLRRRAQWVEADCRESMSALSAPTRITRASTCRRNSIRRQSSRPPLPTRYYPVSPAIRRGPGS